MTDLVVSRSEKKKKKVGSEEVAKEEAGEGNKKSKVDETVDVKDGVESKKKKRKKKAGAGSPDTEEVAKEEAGEGNKKSKVDETVDVKDGVESKKKKRKKKAVAGSPDTEEVAKEEAGEGNKKSKVDETVDVKDGVESKKKKRKKKAVAGSPDTEEVAKEEAGVCKDYERPKRKLDESTGGPFVKKTKVEEVGSEKAAKGSQKKGSQKKHIDEYDYEGIQIQCEKLGLNIDARTPIVWLVHSGVVADQNMLRSEESLKKSWDSGWVPPISYKLLTRKHRSQKTEVKQYLKSAKDNNYFDAPPPIDRPDSLTQGLYLILPEKKEEVGWGQDDHMFWIHHNFIKFARLTPNLGRAAVLYHNFVTGSNLKFDKFQKANLFFAPGMQIYFITLDVKDESDNAITCRSTVGCSTRHNEWMKEKFDDKPVVLNSVFVWSFRCDK